MNIKNRLEYIDFWQKANIVVVPDNASTRVALYDIVEKLKHTKIAEWNSAIVNFNAGVQTSINIILQYIEEI